MAIDCHTHVAIYEELTPGHRAFVATVRPDYFDGFSERYGDPAAVDAMLEGAGIEHAVVLADYSLAVTGRASIEYVTDFCQGSRRLIAFANVNPWLDSNLPERLAYAVEERGCRGLKLQPSYQYFAPNDPMLYPLYAKAQELEIPVTFHTGSSVFPGARLKFADPLLLDDLATDFPRLRVLMAHGGRPFWHAQASFLARTHPNFYLELSGLPPKNLLTYFPDLERLAPKTVFGSDWPGIPTSIRENLDDLRALPISDGAKQAILEDNARALLQL